MKSQLLYFARLHYNATSVQRIQRLLRIQAKACGSLVLAVKLDAGKATFRNIMELSIIQAIQTYLREIPIPEQMVDTDLIWPEKHN